MWPIDTCLVQYVSRFFSLVWRLWIYLTPPVSCASMVQKAFPPVHEPHWGSKPLRLISFALLLFTLLTYLPAAAATRSFYLCFIRKSSRKNEGKSAHHFALIIGLSSAIVWKKKTHLRCFSGFYSCLFWSRHFLVSTQGRWSTHCNRLTVYFNPRSVSYHR